MNILKDIHNMHLSQPRKHVNLDNFVDYFDSLSKGRMEFFSNDLLPFIASLVFQTPRVFENQPIVLLLQDMREERSFTKLQVAVLVANMMFLTLHKQKVRATAPFSFSNSNANTIDTSFPEHVTFDFLYMKSNISPQVNQLRKEKLEFLFAYFEKLHRGDINLDLFVTFERLGYTDSNPRLLSRDIAKIESPMIKV